MMLGGARPVVKARCVALAAPLHFLEKDDIRVQQGEALTQFVDAVATVDRRNSLMDVVGRDAQTRGFPGTCVLGAR